MVSPILLNILKTAATLASCNLFLSLIPELRRVHSERSVATMPLLPILSMFASSTCWVIYGFVVADYFPLSSTNAIGVLLSLAYLVVYFLNAAELKNRVLLSFALTLAVLLALICYSIWCPFSDHSLKLQLGYLSVGVAAVLFGSPLVVVKQVVAEKNSVYLPRAMVFAGLLNSALWGSYGVLISDMFVASPNFINGMLGLLQLVLIVVFPKRQLGAQDDDCLEAGEAHYQVCRSAVDANQRSLVVVSPSPATKDATQYASLKSPTMA